MTNARIDLERDKAGTWKTGTVRRNDRQVFTSKPARPRTGRWAVPMRVSIRSSRLEVVDIGDGRG